MKAIIRLLIGILFVLTDWAPARSAERINSLPIGSKEKVKEYILQDVNNIAINFYDVLDTNAPMSHVLDINYGNYISYSQSMGSLESAVSNLIQVYLGYFLKHGDLEGTKAVADHTYFAFIQVDAYYDGGERFGSMLESSTKRFRFTVMPDGSLAIPPEATEFTIDYTGLYMGLQVGGVHWVDLVYYGLFDYPSYEWHRVTRNGAPDYCWLSRQYGNGVLYLPSYDMSGENIYDWDWQIGEVVLYYNEAMTDYDRFDLRTGEKINLRLAMGAYGSGGLAVVLEGAIPNKSYVLEAGSDLAHPISEVVGVASAGLERRIVFPMGAEADRRFFRAREARPGETALRAALQKP
jgi:hypothetical protein